MRICDWDFNDDDESPREHVQCMLCGVCVCAPICIGTGNERQKENVAHRLQAKRRKKYEESETDEEVEIKKKKEDIHTEIKRRKKNRNKTWTMYSCI